MLPEDFQKTAGILRLRNSLKARFFSVSAVREAATLLNIRVDESSRDWLGLQALHCVEWKEMPPDVEEHVRHLVKGMFNLQEVFEAEEIRPEPKIPQPQVAKPSSSVLRLFVKGR